MPAPKFWAYVKMMPRLLAEKKLAEANLKFATEGQGMSDEARSGFLGELQAQAGGGLSDATMGSLADANVTVIHEDAEPAAEGSEG